MYLEGRDIVENGKFKEGKIREIYLQYDSICKNIDRFDGNFSKNIMSEKKIS